MSKPSWFIAFDAPIRLMSETPPANVRLLHPQDFHLTVSFFADAGLERSRKAWRLLTKQLPPALVARAANFCWFGGRTPRAIACEFQGEALTRWIERQRPRLLLAADCEPDMRPVRPHATIARINRRANLEERAAAELWMRKLKVEPAALTLDRLALYAWAEPRKAGAPRYRRVEHVTLTRPVP